MGGFYDRHEETRDVSVARVGGVEISRADRVFFPELELTKLEVAHYYERVASWILPYLRGRPISILRCSGQSREDCALQHRASPEVSMHVPRLVLEEQEGPVEYLTVDGSRSLLALVELDAVEMHAWNARGDRVERPDQMIFELQPGPDASWSQVVAAGVAMRELLDDLGLAGFALLSGGEALHVVVPIERRTEWPQVGDLGHGLALSLARRNPDAWTAQPSGEDRGRKVYLDHQRNARGATSIAPYSVRALPGGPVALPVRWDELDPGAGKPPRYRPEEVLSRLEQLDEDPWSELRHARRAINQNMHRKLGL
jgi:bifunctional non-homologous end joining protein LigD